MKNQTKSNVYQHQDFLNRKRQQFQGTKKDSQHFLEREAVSHYQNFSMEDNVYYDGGGGGGNMSKYVTTEVFEAHKEHMDTRFKESKDFIKENFDRVDKRFDGVDIKIDRLVNKDNSEMSNLTTSLHTLNSTINTLDFTTTKLNTKTNIMEAAYTRLSDTNEELITNFKKETNDDILTIKKDLIEVKDKMNNLSWQLIGIIVIPILLGVWLIP